jgi:hypothetical protein
MPKFYIIPTQSDGRSGREKMNDSKIKDESVPSKKIIILVIAIAFIVIAFSFWGTYQGRNEMDHSMEEKKPGVNKTSFGIISQDEIWNDEMHIIGDIQVEEDVTLTIMPGSRITIAANSDANNLITEEVEMRQGIQNESENLFGVHMGEPWRDEGNHVSIIIKGTLQAIGTPDNMITITSDSPTPGIYDWNRFQFAHGSLSYVKMSYYRICSPGPRTVISHNVLSNVGECAIGNTSGIIEFNTISYAGHELIDLHGASPIIRNNQLGPNPDMVGIIIDGGAPDICQNTIEGCAMGIVYLSESDAQVLDNVFCDNGEDIVIEP